MYAQRILSTIIILIVAVFIAGCSDDGGSSGSTNNLGTVKIIHDEVENVATLARGAGEPFENVHTFEFTGYDAYNDKVYGPVQKDIAREVTLNDVPLTVDQMNIDYLRNAGFRLRQAQFPVQLGDDLAHTENNPAHQEVTPHTTKWTIETKGKGYQLYVNDKPIRIKGVCYSPAPINFTNKWGPAIGDLFWDSYPTVGKDGKPVTVNNWYSLWGDQNLKGTPYHGRDDLTKIRQMGANCIRVYSMISRQLALQTKDDPHPPPIPDLGHGHHYKHEVFLDKCWNNGNDPIYVLVDIPMPAAAFNKKEVPLAGEIEWWEYTLKETVQDLEHYPAVMGFNIQNEHQSTGDVFPSKSNYLDADVADHFFSQAKKYADLIKNIVKPKNTNKNKLVGWANFDDPVWVYCSSVKYPKYAEMLSSFDFWGVNTYQYSHNETAQETVFDMVVGDKVDVANHKCGLGYLKDTVRKPVIFTEYGWPATGHNPEGDDKSDGKIQESAATRLNTANAVKAMFPKAYAYDILLGAFYFEFSDEWWKDDGTPISEWNGGVLNTNRPNRYNDEEGFGLYSIKRGEGRTNDDNPWDDKNGSPRLPADVVTARQEIINELSHAWGGGETKSVKLKNDMNPDTAKCWFVWGTNAQDWRVIGPHVSFGDTQEIALPQAPYHLAVHYEKAGVPDANACMVNAADVEKIKNGEVITVIGRWVADNGNGPCAVE